MFCYEKPHLMFKLSERVDALSCIKETADFIAAMTRTEHARNRTNTWMFVIPFSLASDLDFCRN